MTFEYQSIVVSSRSYKRSKMRMMHSKGTSNKHKPDFFFQSLLGHKAYFPRALRIELRALRTMGISLGS